MARGGSYVLWLLRLRGFVSIGAGAGGGGVYSPKLDFSDARNSQYIALVF